MLSTKTIDDKIISKLRDLPNEGKQEALVYIDQLKKRKIEKTIRLLKKTSGAWKGLVEADKLKDDIYSDRLVLAKSKAKL